MASPSAPYGTRLIVSTSEVQPSAAAIESRFMLRICGVNRLVGDAQPGAKKTTFTAGSTYRADAPLRPAGLIGPVQLLRLGAGASTKP